MRKIVTIILLGFLAVQPLNAQKMGGVESQIYKRIQRLLDNRHYSMAYAVADSLHSATIAALADLPDSVSSRRLITSSWYMERAAIHYQENVKDSSFVRLRAILPHLTQVDRSLCYLFLEQIDSALADTLVLRNVPNTQIAEFCTSPDTQASVNTTPTMYDLMMRLAMERVSLEQCVELSRQLVAWYRTLPATKENVTLLLYNELRYIDFRLQNPNVSNRMRYTLYQDCLNRFRHYDQPQIATLYLRLAQQYNEDSNYLAAIAYCDSAISRYPKSEGGAECANLRSRIIEPMIMVEVNNANPAGRELLCRVGSRNTDTLFYRLVTIPKSVKPINGYNAFPKLRNQFLGYKVLKSWSQPLGVESDHKYNLHYGYIPALPSGYYALMVSPTSDFRSNGFYFSSFAVLDAAFVRTKYMEEGYLVDYVTGKPIPNQKVELLESALYAEKYNVVASAKTDSLGFYHFDKKYFGNKSSSSFRLQTHYKGIDIHVDDYFYDYTTTDSVRNERRFFLDRPVYRPGDTVQFLYIGGQVCHNREGRLLAGDSLKIRLTDVNGNPVDSLWGVTDAYGSFSGRLVIPSNVLPGYCDLAALICHEGGHYPDAVAPLRVEAYKQPKFTVTLASVNRRDADGNSVQPAMGDSLVVEGLASSYTQMPIGNARVTYSVTRSILRPWWRRFYNASLERETVVCSGSTAIDADGRFRIAFVAMPDSSLNLDDKPCFVYTVFAEVTDVNGETHSQTLLVKLGYENSYINITTADECSVLDAVEYQYCDLNGIPLQGNLKMDVERLCQPEGLWIPHGLLKECVRQTMSEADFHSHFPLTPYSYEETNMAKWRAEEVVFTTQLQCKGLSSNRVPLPRLATGVYRIRMSCGDVKGEKIVVYTPQNSSNANSMQLIWFDKDRETAQVGDTVVVRVGTRHKDVVAVYQLRNNNREFDRRLLMLDGNITAIRIPVTEAMLGGFDVCLYAVKEGRSLVEKIHVNVPFVHKRLNMEFLTFRDKLSPGVKETWTLKLSRKASLPSDKDTVSAGVGAAMLLTMYDAALDNYGRLNNTWFPWSEMISVDPRSVSFHFSSKLVMNYNLIFNPAYVYHRPSGKGFQSWNFTALNHRGWRWRQDGKSEIAYATAGGARLMTLQQNKFAAKRLSQKEDRGNSLVADFEIVEEEAFEADEMMDAGYGAQEGIRQKGQKEPYIRSNLSTLAFFEPTLRTDSNGTVVYSFTAPDLLTKWNIEGLAWTQDLAVGQFERTLVTQKQLMIQPNMPRFLREDDTATLMAKVMNLTDSDLVVTVEFTFNIPTMAGQPAATQSGCEVVKVPAHGSVPVTFRVTAPVGGTVGVYKYLAYTSRHSDGEQGILPLLSNRQAVTTSVSMYTNGKGIKQYTIDFPTSATAQPVSFNVEYTANPIWLAIQSLPYMSECKNPSNIYLLNSYYVNTLGKTIADRYPELKHCADNADEEVGAFFTNADIKQTLLEETPWLHDANSETQRLKNIAQYYDGEALQRQIDEDFAKLKEAQNADGGWSWMPKGHYGSTYITQYILKGFGNMSRQLPRTVSTMEKRALDYIDKEAYKEYAEWMEYCKRYPNSQCKPIMLDYLYTRSYYSAYAPNATTRKAYDYYYSNAKERYGDYTTLYTQALLALVFHRHGDKRLAREMVFRIKEKALYSDEMGMYWRDNIAGRFYYERPIETQALLIETFREVLPADTASVAQMQQWLLKQKQTTHWGSDIATLRAIQSLMPIDVEASRRKSSEDDTIILNGKIFSDTLCVAVADGSVGHIRQTYRDSMLAALSDGRSLSVTIVRPGRGVSWGALYYQYTELMDKIPFSETGITLRRQIYRVEPDGGLTEVKENDATIKVGDRLRVRLMVSCDRNLEYVELKEFRAACLEPVSTSSGWVWGRELNYYVAVNNSHNAVYIDRLEKGKYVIDADYYVTNPGAFTLAPSVLQCLYAPEFRATSQGKRMVVR